jgi:uncharacterized protein
MNRQALHGAGIGLKPQHVDAVLAQRPALGFFEVHAENYLVDGGPMHHDLGRIRAHYALSLHGVGLSLGGEAPPDEDHLADLARLIARYQPAVFSEHLAWSTHGEVFLNDLLPVAYDEVTLARVCRHIDRVQERLGRRLLLENPSTYVEFERSTMSEAGFLREVQRRTGCGLLLDLTNLHVSCTNHARDPWTCLDELPLDAVGEIHLAGFSHDRDSLGDTLLIDSHDRAVEAVVWRLYEAVLARLGPVPTLIERDADLPPLPVLVAEAQRAQAALDAAGGPARRAA